MNTEMLHAYLVQCGEYVTFMSLVNNEPLPEINKKTALDFTGYESIL